MKIFLKILKWVGISIGSFIMILILVGLAFRLFGPEPQKPEGKLVDIGGIKLHINAAGEKSEKPTLVIEGGAGTSSDYYYWLNEGLKDSMRVVRYDRAGVGYSELSDTPRDPETIANELHALLEKSGESPPYIMAGHSFGGPYIRVFTKLYPDEVVGLVFLDASHPEQVERINLTQKSSNKFKLVMSVLSLQAVLGDLGILTLYESLTGPILAAEGLPDEINNRTRDFFIDGKYVRAYRNELKWYHSGLERAALATNFDSLPIRVFTATEGNDSEWLKMQQEMANLSTDGKQISIDGNHATIFTKKENADIICAEIIQLLDIVEY